MKIRRLSNKGPEALCGTSPGVTLPTSSRLTLLTHMLSMASARAFWVAPSSCWFAWAILGIMQSTNVLMLPTSLLCSTWRLLGRVPASHHLTMALSSWKGGRSLSCICRHIFLCAEGRLTHILSIVTPTNIQQLSGFYLRLCSFPAGLGKGHDAAVLGSWLASEVLRVDDSSIEPGSLPIPMVFVKSVEWGFYRNHGTTFVSFHLFVYSGKSVQGHLGGNPIHLHCLWPFLENNLPTRDFRSTRCRCSTGGWWVCLYSDWVHIRLFVFHL